MIPETNRCRQYAIQLLSKRSLLSSELENRLSLKGFSSEAVSAVIALCREKGYLNDEAEVTRRISKEQRKGRSVKAIFFKLKMQKGINLDLSRLTDDSEALYTQLNKYKRKIDLNDPVQKQKLIAKLYRQGFSFDAISKALCSI